MSFFKNILEVVKVLLHLGTTTNLLDFEVKKLWSWPKGHMFIAWANMEKEAAAYRALEQF